MNETLKELRLSSNVIGDGGARAFAEVLLANEKLVSVDLRDNPIGDKEGDDRDPIDVLLAETLVQNRTLRSLNDITLDDPDIYDDGVSVSRIHHHVHHHHHRHDLADPKHQHDKGGRRGAAEDSAAAAAAAAAGVEGRETSVGTRGTGGGGGGGGDGGRDGGRHGGDGGGGGGGDDVSILSSPDRHEVASIDTSHPPPDHAIDLTAHQSDGFQVFEAAFVGHRLRHTHGITSLNLSRNFLYVGVGWRGGLTTANHGRWLPPTTTSTMRPAAITSTIVAVSSAPATVLASRPTPTRTPTQPNPTHHPQVPSTLGDSSQLADGPPDASGAGSFVQSVSGLWGWGGLFCPLKPPPLLVSLPVKTHMISG